MNKVTIVTGSSRGIGAATAKLAAKRGYAMCVNYLRNRAGADAVVRAIEDAGGNAIAVAVDVASESDVLRLFETVDKELGLVTALVNNAGILEQQTRLENMDAARLNRVFTVNITGCFLMGARSGAAHVHRARRERRSDCECVVQRIAPRIFR